MRISDWSSDVCSSDLAVQWLAGRFKEDVGRLDKELRDGRRFILDDELSIADFSLAGYLFWSNQAQEIGRASCRERGVSVRVDLGGRSIIKQKSQYKNSTGTKETWYNED